MAYCKRCGAYIPDGLTACLACGYDEVAESSQGTAVATQDQNEDFRVRYEEERRRRQEENARWAEEEHKRREAEERRRLEEERRRLEEERKRLEQERILRQAQERRDRFRSSYRYTSPGTESDVYSRTGTATPSASDERGKSRVFAALSYLSALWILPFIFRGNDEFARYHARQGIGLFVFSLVCDAIGIVTPFAWLFRLYFMYKGMMNALNDRKAPLPLFGKWFEKE